MSRLVLLFAVAALAPLGACTSLRETAAERCRGLYPPGSAAYAACVHREYERELAKGQQYLDQLREQERHGGY